MIDRLTKTAEDKQVEDKLWEVQKREVIRIASEFNEAEAGGCGMEEELLTHYKARGYPKGIIRGVAGAVKPETAERRLEAYRERIGL